MQYFFFFLQYFANDKISKNNTFTSLAVNKLLGNEKKDIKIRFFKLSFIEDELNAEEYITWEGIVNVAKFMGLC